MRSLCVIMKSSPHWLQLEKAQLIVKTQCSQRKKDTNLKKKEKHSTWRQILFFPLTNKLSSQFYQLWIFTFKHPCKDTVNKSWSMRSPRNLPLYSLAILPSSVPSEGLSQETQAFFCQSLLDCLAYCPEQLLVNFSTFLPLNFSYARVNRVDLFGSM